MTSTAFDDIAGRYDAVFTENPLGQHLRRAVWHWLDRAFPAGGRVLELNCGTGADAQHLATRGVRVYATDASSAMLDIARVKCEPYVNRGLVELHQLPIEQLNGLRPAAPFDGAFSNFGGLNCVADITPVAASLADLLMSGAHFIACVMGPVVPWEWVWYVCRADFRRAFRRLGGNGTRWRGMRISYPWIHSVRKAFEPWFRLERQGAVGVLLPPTYAGRWANRHPRILRRLAHFERRIEGWPGVAWLGDHYLADFVRR